MLIINILLESTKTMLLHILILTNVYMANSKLFLYGKYISLTHTPFHSLSLSLSLSLSHTHTHSFSPSLFLSLTHSFFLSLSLSLPHCKFLSLPLRNLLNPLYLSMSQPVLDRKSVV